MSAIAAVVGSTGMIGQELIRQLSNDPYYSGIRMLVRRPQASPHPKVEVKLVDFNDAESLMLAMDGAEVVFCAIGTTQKKVKGDRKAYTQIDFDIPVRVARCCQEIDCRRIVIVTAIGANSRSSNFYLKLNGHVEDAISLEPLEAVHFFQPSQLLGPRAENRPLEKISIPIMKFLAPLLRGSWRKYRPIEGSTVAKAMIEVAKSDARGVHRYTYDDIMAKAGMKKDVVNDNS